MTTHVFLGHLGANVVVAENAIERLAGGSQERYRAS
jgi:hypothetical protein